MVVSRASSMIVPPLFLEYESRYGRLHGAGKHFFSLRDGIAFLPDGNITKHPQCFGKYTHL